MERRLVEHLPGRPGFTACHLVWTRPPAGTLLRCPDCVLAREPRLTMLAGSHPRLIRD